MPDLAPGPAELIGGLPVTFTATVGHATAPAGSPLSPHRPQPGLALTSATMASSRSRTTTSAPLAEIASVFVKLTGGEVEQRLTAGPIAHARQRDVREVIRHPQLESRGPIVLSAARALLATSDGVTAVDADLRDPAAVLTTRT